MKRLFITFLIMFCALAMASAQEEKAVRYRELKSSYNHKEYVRQATDPYNIGWYECASFFAPGVGQLLSGETGRGLAFIGAEAVLIGIITDAASTIDKIAITGERGFLTGYTDPVKGKTYGHGLRSLDIRRRRPIRKTHADRRNVHENKVLTTTI